MEYVLRMKKIVVVKTADVWGSISVTNTQATVLNQWRELLIL